MDKEITGDRRNILEITMIAAWMGLLILLVGILPAELGRDPTGLGKILGTDKLYARPNQLTTGALIAASSTSSKKPFVSYSVDIPLAPGADPEHRDELEYKVRMEKGATYVYSWEVVGIDNPQYFYSDFHGHTSQNGSAMTVGEYRKAQGSTDNGRLIAPFTGVHGWYFQNQSTRPVIVRLRLAGFYTLVPPGEEGNEASLLAKPLPTVN
jgi:hypothetical protein